MDTGQTLVIGLCGVLALWFVGGWWVNRRLGRQVWRWLRPGLETQSAQVSMRWIGTAGSGVQAVVRQAAPPFSQIEILAILEPREILPLWLFNRLRGKRDELIVRAHLRSPGKGAFEVVPQHSQLADALRREHGQPWSWLDGSPGLSIAYRGQGARINAAQQMIADYGPCLQRVSWRKTKPHLLIRAHLAGLMQQSAEKLLQDLTAYVS